MFADDCHGGAEVVVYYEQGWAEFVGGLFVQVVLVAGRHFASSTIFSIIA